MKKLLFVSSFSTLFFWSAYFVSGGVLAKEYNENNQLHKAAALSLDSLSPIHSKTTRRSLTLPNNLDVLLVSNPNRAKASAALDVKVGSLAEPKKFPGLAHFLEHLLFLGTRKYPEVDGYKKHIEKFQGSHNAFTSRENTNYHFSINHEGYEEALDRFAQFFIEPSFHPEFVDKERKAVNDEAVMLKNRDVWKRMILFSRLMDPEHAFSRYHPGDLKTLSDISREEVQEFYRSFYSASDMSLVLDSRESLDQMEAWVRKIFAAIPDRGKKRPSYPSQLFKAEKLPLLVEVSPIKSERKLTLHFSLGSLDELWESKPDRMLSHLIGHEGTGSLLSLLKKEKLALSLSAGFEQHSFASVCEVNIELTEKGNKEYLKVVEHFFSYIKLLQQEGLPRYLFDEVANMAQLDYLHSNENGADAGQHAIFLSQYLYKFPAQTTDQRMRLFYRYDPVGFKNVLSHLVPENLILMHSYPKVKTSLIEQDFNTGYSQLEVSPQLLKSWQEVKVHESLSLPEPNPYIPDVKHEAKVQVSEPEKLLENEWGSFWVRKDHITHEPKIKLRLLLLIPEVNKNPTSKVLTQLYLMGLKDSINEWKYQLDLAGISFHVISNHRGIELMIEGFADKANIVIESLVGKLTNSTLNLDKLDIFKAKLIESYENLLKENPYQLAFYEVRHLLTPGSISFREVYDAEKGVDLISPVTKEQVLSHRKTIYGQVAVEGSAYGDIDKTHLRGSLERSIKSLGTKPLPAEERPGSLSVELSGPKQKSLETKLDNHCWLQVMQFGGRDPRLDAGISIGLAYLEPHFFNSLRTVQKMGYVVSTSKYNTRNRLGLYFLIQSSTHNPVEIEQAVLAWKKSGLEALSKLKKEEFEEYKAAVIADLLQEKKELASLFHELDSGAYDLDGNFRYRQQVAEEAKKLSLEDTCKLYQANLLSEKTSALDVSVLSKPN
ncbi:MAG: insulinase family protein [Oligoflexales bacterium]|nr:insulinase family protein [Oligoflexales bacterium]